MILSAKVYVDALGLWRLAWTEADNPALHVPKLHTVRLWSCANPNRYGQETAQAEAARQLGVSLPTILVEEEAAAA